MFADPQGRSVAPSSRRRCAVAALSVPLLGALALAGASTARADGPDHSVTVGIPSVFYNGHTDVGAVQNRVDGGGEQLLSQHQLLLGSAANESGARFGTALLFTDLNGDDHSDLIVSAPGTPSRPNNGDPGHVYLLFGSPTGLVAAGAITLSAPAGAEDEFGSALAVSDGELWVGAPGHDVAGQADAGAVFRYSLGTGGAPTYLDTVTRDSALVPGAAAAGERFGSVLATATGGVMVGVPLADVSSAQDAGSVVQLREDANHALTQAVEWTQDSPGVPGVAEAGDHYGAAVSRAGIAVGVPGEDIGALKDAGSVQTFGTDPTTGALIPSAAFTQNSAGVPGTAEAGDRYGTAVVVGLFSCSETEMFAAGAPGEDIGKIKDAGSVTVTMLPAQAQADDHHCPSVAYSQGSGLPGAAEAGDEVGAALGRGEIDPDADEDAVNQLLIGDPGEDVGSLKDVGRVYLGTGIHARSEGLVDGDVAGLRFGSVFSS